MFKGVVVWVIPKNPKKEEVQSERPGPAVQYKLDGGSDTIPIGTQPEDDPLSEETPPFEQTISMAL